MYTEVTRIRIKRPTSYHLKKMLPLIAQLLYWYSNAETANHRGNVTSQ